MSDHPPFRKVFDGVATRERMFQLFDRHRGTPGNDPLSGAPYDGEWFELQGSTYHFMLDLLPPLFMRTGMFGLSEYKAGLCDQRLLRNQDSGPRALVSRLLQPRRQAQPGCNAGGHHRL
ncbi:DUF1419 domain-containing protein [Mesorhizobium comanense]|uniref:DUF1419 domain-containing protein n=1 Tax=Mesorhizobium comanense TaxID=2502215 RepID=UPI001E41A5B2|nr:DUF1419 domain-containing protein [Mesorhizobium comanense]